MYDRPSQQGKDTPVSKNAEKRRQDQLNMATTILSATPGFGERLLPYLVAAMETCWVDAVLIALASLNLFLHGTPLMPLWSPFVLMISACGLLTFLERREIIQEQAAKDNQKRISGSSWFFLCLTFLMLIVIWASVYAAAFLFFDPRWLLLFLNDLFQLNANFYYVLLLLALSVYFCWRGTRLARRTIEPGNIFWHLRLGMGVIIVAIIIHSSKEAGTFNELLLFGIVPLFLFLALVAHALAKALFLRSNAPGGLQGSVVGQESAILTIMSLIGIFILLLAVSIGSFASPAFLQEVQRGLEPLGRFYNWLISIIAYGITFLAYPIFWLFSLLHIQVPPPHIVFYKDPVTGRATPASSSDPIITIVVPALKIILPLLFMTLLAFLISRLIRRRRIRLMLRERQDISESIWSWDLFITQLKAFLLAIWLRLLPRHTDRQETFEEEIQGEETARSIRAIYRAMLRWAAMRGYGRRREETPYEFKERLQQKIPQGDFVLDHLTRAYSELRYGDHVPDEMEVAGVRKDWEDLQRKI